MPVFFNRACTTVQGWQNVVYTLSMQQPKTPSKIHTSLWILKISRKKSANQNSQRLLPSVSYFQKENHTLGYGLKNLQEVYSLAYGFCFLWLPSLKEFLLCYWTATSSSRHKWMEYAHAQGGVTAWWRAAWEEWEPAFRNSSLMYSAKSSPLLPQNLSSCSNR
jgi:hypothetical protein